MKPGAGAGAGESQAKTSLTGASNRRWGHLTAELFPEKVHEMGPAHRVFQESPEAEAPSLHTEPRGYSHTGEGWVCQEHEDCGVGGTVGKNAADPPSPLSSLGGVHGPVGVIVCDPGVAGQAPRHDGVMRAMLTAELQVPGGGDGVRGHAGRGSGSRALEEGSGLWAWASSCHPHPTHASRQTEDFTRILPRAFVQHSIYNTEL